MLIFYVRPGNTDNGVKPEFSIYLLIYLGFRLVILLVSNPKTHKNTKKECEKPEFYVTRTQNDLTLSYILHISNLKTCTQQDLELICHKIVY